MKAFLLTKMNRKANRQNPLKNRSLRKCRLKNLPKNPELIILNFPKILSMNLPIFLRRNRLRNPLRNL
jgi:hypothetical protein